MERRKFCTHFCNHHMAVEGAPALGSRRSVNMRPDLCHNGSAKGHVWNEVAVHLVRRCVRELPCLGGRAHTISTCSQSAPSFIVSEQAAPKEPKSAERMDGAIMAGGDI